MRIKTFLLTIFYIVVCLTHTLSAQAQLTDFPWRFAGPEMIADGNVEGITNSPVTGTILAVSTHPTDPNIVFAGTANNGIWRSDNALSGNPTWTNQTVGHNVLAIADISFDPTDLSGNTLIAGIGWFTELNGANGAFSSMPGGVLHTSDGGDNWTYHGNYIFDNPSIHSVVARGNTWIVASDNSRGVFRSINSGATWTAMSIGDGTETGLPAGIVSDMTGDPSNSDRLFAVVGNGQGTSGIFRSDNLGETWTRISNPAIDNIIVERTSTLAVGKSDNVYFATKGIADETRVFRSADSGDSWTEMDTPLSANGGIRRFGNGYKLLSVLADPSNADIVYVGAGENNTADALGAETNSGKLARGDASKESGSQFVHLANRNNVSPAGGGTANNSAPHASSRDMAMTANGVLIQVDGGGIYRRTNPQSNTGDWFSMIGNLVASEIISVEYDSVSDVILASTATTGVIEQVSPGSTNWRALNISSADHIAIDDYASKIVSTRYVSRKGGGSAPSPDFQRQTVNALNEIVSITYPALTAINNSPSMPLITQTPILVNRFESERLVFGTREHVYESLDGGETVTMIGENIRVRPSARSFALAYGAEDNVNIVYAGSSNGLFIRFGPQPATFLKSTSFPSTKIQDDPREIAIHPRYANTAIVATRQRIYMTTDGGLEWSNISGNLTEQLFHRTSLSIFDALIAGILYLPGKTGDSIVIGTVSGVFVSNQFSGFTDWIALGYGLPASEITDLDFDDERDLLVVGTLGGGVWTHNFQNDRIDIIFGDDFEP